MEWVEGFYSKTGEWWGPAESGITERDHNRAKLLKQFAGEPRKSVLELGSAYGNTAVATAEAGYDVTGIEISSRIDFAQKHVEKEYLGSLRFRKEDFYKFSPDHKFDVVAYWNGFGIGEDEDQKRLLSKMAEWLTDNGVVLMDVQNPIVWQRWSGEEEHKTAKPEVGYNFNVSERIEFDPKTSKAIDTWWQTDKPEEKVTQTLRCYTPNELLDLLKDTGLKMETIIIEGNPVNNEEANQLLADPQKEHSEYLVKLTKAF